MAKLSGELNLFKSGYISSDIGGRFPRESLDDKGEPNRLASKVKSILNFTRSSAKVRKMLTEPRLAEFADTSMSEQELDGVDPFEVIPSRKENYTSHVEVSPSPSHRKLAGQNYNDVPFAVIPSRKEKNSFHFEVSPSPPRQKLAGQKDNDVKCMSPPAVERSHHNISKTLAFNPFDVTLASIEFESCSAVIENEDTSRLLDLSLSVNCSFPSRRDFDRTPDASHLGSDPLSGLLEASLENSLNNNISSFSDLRPLQLYKTSSKSPMPAKQNLTSQIDAENAGSVKTISDSGFEVSTIKRSGCPTSLEGVAPQEQPQVPNQNVRRVCLLLCITVGEEGIEVEPVS